jgi:hypothetical protein
MPFDFIFQFTENPGEEEEYYFMEYPGGPNSSNRPPSFVTEMFTEHI